MKQLIFIATLFFASVGFTQSKQLMKLSDGVERYVEFTPPQGDKPWIVMTNGLVYDINRWGAMDAELKKQGYGIVHYYFRGQDLTLRREVEVFKTPSFFANGLTPQDFVQELKEIVQKLNIKKKIILVGLSYGAHVAANFAQTYPQAVEKLVFMAPLVVPLEKYQPQGAWLDWNLSWVKTLWGNMYYEYAYRQIYGAYLSNRGGVPPSLAKMPNEYRTSLFHLVRVTRDFDLKTYGFEKMSPNSVHFMVAQEETQLAFNDQVMAFDRLSKKAQGSLIWFPEAQHAIPDAAPALAAKTLDQLIQGGPMYRPGKKYKSTSQGLTNL
jgi:pimeloyl-ACP methyl ester carboxylesterase